MQRPMPTRLAATLLVLAAALAAAAPASAGDLHLIPPGFQPAHPAAPDARRPAPAPAPVQQVRRPEPPAMHGYRPEPAYHQATTRVVVGAGPVYVQPAPQYVAQPRYVPQPVYVAQPRYVPQPVYVAQPQYAQADWACGAPRWDPSVRYMPGQVVRRHGSLYIATDLSASVWNENSPPEWTPTYWVPAVCSQ